MSASLSLPKLLVICVHASAAMDLLTVGAGSDVIFLVTLYKNPCVAEVYVTRLSRKDSQSRWEVRLRSSNHVRIRLVPPVQSARPYALPLPYLAELGGRLR